MRCCYQVVLSLIFVALSVTAYSQQSAYQQEVFTGPRAGARVHSGVSTGYHQIAWETSGGPGACLIGLDYSADGMVWYLGATIPIHDCTSSGSSIVAGPQNVNFVRMNMNALSTGSAVRATYTGFQTNPGPTGTVTSVFGRTGQIQAQQGDYSVALITGAAPLFSPTFQGQPTAPTPAPGDSSTLVATTAFVAQAIAGCCGGGGGGGAVTSVFGRTGAVTAQSGDFTVSQITGAAPLASPNFSGTPTGPTAAVGTNTTQLATTAFVLANQGTGGGGGIPGLTSDGTTLTFTGTGGVHAPSFTTTGTGGFSLTSVVGVVPAPPAAGNNALVSGPDGWYVSDNGAPFIGPLGTGGGGTGAGVSSFNNRTGAVAPVAADYSAFFAPINGTITGTGTANFLPVFTGASAGATSTDLAASALSDTANTLNYGGTGGMTLSNPPPPGDNSNHVATTAWVTTHAGGGGGTGPLPIVRGPTVCNGVGGQSTITVSGLTIEPGDTVFISSVRNTASLVSVTDNGGTDYMPVLDFFTQGNATVVAWARNNVANPASTATITVSAAAQITMCVTTYKNVASWSSAITNQLGSGLTLNTTFPAATSGSEIFSIFGQGSFNTVTSNGNGTLMGSARGATTSSLAVCGNHVANSGSISCGVTFSGSSAIAGMGFELFPAVGAVATCAGGQDGGPVCTPASATPAISSATSIPATTLCSTAACPAGLYEVIAYSDVTTACTTGGSYTVHALWTDEGSAKNTTFTNLDFSSVTNFASSNVVLYSTGAQPIQFSTTATACASGSPGTGHLHMSVRRR